MLIGGEKWACEACVRGHRVSNCQHSDRPLQHINKKGRPVSQCQHCRTLRKSRSAHVRCDCGNEKVHNKEISTIEGVTQANACLCSYGGRCACALKKEPLDPVLESDSDGPSIAEKRRARAHTKSPENGLTIFTNGYHKPAHKHNNTAQKYGSPYPAPRSQSLRGPSPTSRVSQTECCSSYPTKIEDNNPTVYKKPIDTLAEQNFPISNCTSSNPSPISKGDFFASQVSSVNLFVPGELNWPQNFENISPVPDTESPIYSACMNSASVDWSHYEGLKFNNGKYTAGPLSQPSSYTGFDFASIDQPTLTSTPTSGELSEIDELGPFSDQSSGESIFHHQKFASDQDVLDFSCNIDSYKSSTPSSITHLTQAQVLTNNIHLDDLDAFLKYSNTLSSQSNCLPLSADGSKNTCQDISPFHDDSFEVFLAAEDENEASWLSSFSSNFPTSGASSNQNGLLDSFWA